MKMFALIIFYFITCIYGVVSVVVTRQCLQCICQATTNCNVNVGCIPKLDNIHCGPYQISLAYWMDAGSIDVYNRCTNEMKCSQKIIINYMNKYANDCDKNGHIDCIDFASIHHLGNACSNTSYLQTTSFWNEFKKTACYYENFITYYGEKPTSVLSSNAKSKNGRYLNWFKLNAIRYSVSPTKSKKSLLSNLFNKSSGHTGYNSNKTFIDYDNHSKLSTNLSSTSTNLQLLPQISPKSSLNYTSLLDILKKSKDTNHSSYLFANERINYLLNEQQNPTETTKTINNVSRVNSNNNIDESEKNSVYISPECLLCIREVFNDHKEEIEIKSHLHQEIMAIDQCKTDTNCAYNILEYDIGKYYRDCNHDGFIDCDDFILIYFLGSDCQDKQIYNTSVWRHYEYCTIMSDKARREKYISTLDEIDEFETKPQGKSSTNSPSPSMVSFDNFTSLTSPLWPYLLAGKRSTTFSPTISPIPSTNNQLNTIPSEILKAPTESNKILPLTQSCIECISEASSGYITTANETTCNDGPCGPFQITKAYWLNCGAPGTTGTHYDDFDKCANDFDCSNECVHSYISSSVIDCNNDGYIDCLDFTIIHKLGQQSCKQSALIEPLFETSYWKSFEMCYGFN